MSYITFDSFWKNSHITRKESLMAIRAFFDALADQIPPGTLIVVLVDNITAASVINKRTCAFDADIDSQVQDLWEAALARKVSLLAIYIPGPLQPADEPSRGNP